MLQPASDEKRRVLLIAEPGGGGVRRHVVDLLGALDPAVFEATLLYGTSRIDSSFRAALPALAKQWRLVPMKNLCRRISWRDIPAFFAILGEICRFRPHAVHCHSSKAGVVGRLAAWVARVPIILYTPHGYSFLLAETSPRFRTLYIGIERLFCRCFTTRVIHVSHGEREQGLAAGLTPPERLTVVHNGLPPLASSSRDAARRVLNARPNEYLIGVAARVDDQKNPHLFFEIAQCICAQHTEVRFCWLGDGSMLTELRQRAADAGLAERIVFYGFCEEAPMVTEGFDLYLLTSRCEGLPYGLLEAARAGVAMVATRVTGNDEVVIEGLNGYLFSENDPAQGAACVAQALTKRPFLRELIEQDFNRRFALANMAKQLSAMYRGEV